MKTSKSDMRFIVAISYASERLDFVQQVAKCLALELGERNVLFDRFHQEEFARVGLRGHILKLFENGAELVVAFICYDYKQKEWCKEEWSVIERVIKTRPSDVMLIWFGGVDISALGLHQRMDGLLDVSTKTPEETACSILERLKLNRTADLAKIRALEREIEKQEAPYHANIRRIYDELKKGLDRWRHGGSRVIVIEGPPSCGKSTGIEIARRNLQDGLAEDLGSYAPSVDAADVRTIDLSWLLTEQPSTLEDLPDKLADRVFRGYPRPEIPRNLALGAKIEWVMSHEAAGLLHIIDGHETLARTVVSVPRTAS